MRGRSFLSLGRILHMRKVSTRTLSHTLRYAFMKNSFIFIDDLCWFSVGIRDGMLMKRGRDNGQFFSRRFVLSEREGTLKYFTKYDVSIIFSVLSSVTFIDKMQNRVGGQESDREHHE